MRHFFFSGLTATTIGRLPPGVQQATTAATLVAPPRLPQTPPPRPTATAIRAVPLPPVTPRADVDPMTTEVTHKAAAVGAAASSVHDLVVAWTSSPKPEILGRPGEASPGLDPGDGSGV